MLESKRLLDVGFLRVDRSKISYQVNGEPSDPRVRINVDRGNAAAAILHEPATNTLYFVSQFRFSTYEESNEPTPDNGWLLEVIAGVIEPYERRDEAILREIREETGFTTILVCDEIGVFYLTPGASSEQLYLFYVAVDAAGRERGKAAAAGGDELRGVDDEQIVTIEKTPAQFLDDVAAMRIRDAKTIAAAEYIRRNTALFKLG